MQASKKLWKTINVQQINSYACFHMVSGSLLAAAHANEVNK